MARRRRAYRARKGTLETLLFYAAVLNLAYMAYKFLGQAQARGVTIIPPDEPANLSPGPAPVTLNAVPVGSRFTVQR